MTDKAKLFRMLKTKSFMYRENPPFKLASGAVSPYYFDCRKTLLDYYGLILTGKVLGQVVNDLVYLQNDNITHVGGMTMGADPITYAICLTTGLNPLIIRKEPKDHGTRKQIEGTFSKGNRAIVIDDVITTGGSTIKAIEAMGKENIIVKDAVILLDREEGGREAIEKYGIQVVSIFKASEFKNT